MVSFQNIFINYQTFISSYVDLDYSLWLYWGLLVFKIIFLLPFVYMALIYVSVIILYIYKIYKQFIMRVPITDSNFWWSGVKITATIWDLHGRIFHGYDVIGIDNLPVKDPALIIFYHGTIPFDAIYLCTRLILQRNRVIYSIVDRSLFKLPGFEILANAIGVREGTVQSCSTILQSGNCLIISPGGLYEAQFSDHKYELLLGNRIGFAKVALEAKVPIIPMFTQNIREGYRQVSLFKRQFLWLYNVFRLPLVPIYGGFPVKFRTYLGKPIPYDPNLTPEELKLKVSTALTELISKHQRIPGSIVHGILDRIPFFQKKHE